MVCGVTQQVLGVLPPRIPLDRDVGHTIGFGLPNIGEGMDEYLGASCSSKSDLQLINH